MSETSQVPSCDRCGAALSGHAQDGLCAACLLESAIVEPDMVGDDAAQPTPVLAFSDYELLEEIARGGMGVVYRARQVSLNRPVAIKMILGGHLVNAADMKRFRAEAETAAQLQHPNIVAIHEVGEYAGQPFFSMDLVAGRNLAQVVRNEPLPSRKAASYLKTIAEAVHYAHSRGVLHRDLKPSNVLLDENDQPRVTDFGLAKRLSNSEPGNQDSQLTQTGQVLGSPSFIPPEQAAGQKNAISPASDVYSLGAILYHLLTGRPPFLADSVPATLRMAAESEPVAPHLLNPTIPRDLETICLKCLEKIPLRRYGSAQELAEELGRFLRDEPIHARPASSVERAQRWIRRKPALATAMALVLVVAIGSPLAALRINHERLQAEVNAKKAQLESEKSKQVAKFLQKILRSAGPSVARGRDAALFREMLEATSESVGKEIAGQPEVHGDIYTTVGSAYMDIGDHRRAITNLELAVKSYRIARVGDHPNLACALSMLGYCQSFTEDVTNGNKNARLGLEMARKCNDKETLFTCLMNYSGSFKAWGMSSPESEPYEREAYELKKQMGNDPVGLANAMRTYSGFLTNAEEREQMLRNARDLLQKHLPPGDPRTLQTFFVLGQRLVGSGKFEEAEEALREAHQGYQKTYDPNHPYQLFVLRFLAESLLAQGKGDEAESFVRQQLAATPTNASYQFLLRRVTEFRRDWPLDEGILQHLNGDFLWWDLADKFAKVDEQGEVERLFLDVLERQRERHGSESPEALKATRRLADLYVRHRKFAAAEPMFRKAAEIAQKLPPGTDRDALLEWSLGDLRNVLLKQDKPDAPEITPQMRSDFFARHSRWEDAVANLRQSIESDPNDSVPYFHLAAILASRGEVSDYRQLCQRMLARFGGTADPAVADKVAKACLIDPGFGLDLKVAAELADTAVTRGGSHELLHWFELCKALAEFRRGDFAEAVAWAQKPLARPGEPFERDACANLVLAMAQMRLNQDRAARSTLGKAREIVEGKIPKLDGEDLGNLWVDVIIANVLLREAKALIEGGATDSSKTGE